MSECLATGFAEESLAHVFEPYDNQIFRLRTATVRALGGCSGGGGPAAKHVPTIHRRTGYCQVYRSRNI